MDGHYNSTYVGRAWSNLKHTRDFTEEGELTILVEADWSLKLATDLSTRYTMRVEEYGVSRRFTNNYVSNLTPRHVGGARSP